MAADLKQLARFANVQMLPIKFAGCAIGCGTSAALLAGYVPYGVVATAAAQVAANGGAANRSSDVGDGAVGGDGGVGDGASSLSAFIFPLWTALALSVMAAFHVFFSGILVPYQRTGVFFRTAFRVVFRDVSVSATYPPYPRTPRTLPTPPLTPATLPTPL